MFIFFEGLIVFDKWKYDFSKEFVVLYVKNCFNILF